MTRWVTVADTGQALSREIVCFSYPVSPTMLYIQTTKQLVRQKSPISHVGWRTLPK